MKSFSFQVDSILQELAQVAKVVNNNNALPILSDVFFNVKQNKTIKMTASDGETWVSCSSLVDECDSDICFCVEAASIISALSSLKGRRVTFTFEDESPTINGKYDNGEFSLPFDNFRDFPQCNYVGDEMRKMVLPSKIISNALDTTGFAVSDDELRPVMNGVHFDFFSDKMVAVASDGHKLAKYCDKTVTDDLLEQSYGFTLPDKPATILSKMLQKLECDIVIAFSERNVTFSNDNFSISARLVEGRYPNYESVIPKDNKIFAIVDKKQIIDSINRILQFGSKTSKLTSFKFEYGKLTIGAEDIDFSKKASESIACDYKESEFTIGFNGASVVSIVANVQSEKIVFKMSEPSRAALIEPQTQQDNVEYLFLMMPMQLI